MNDYKADMHVHTKYSATVQSRQEITKVIEAAEEKDLKYIAFTDNVEFSSQPVDEVIHRLQMRDKEINSVQETTKIKIIRGIEISEPQNYIAEINKLYESIELDYVLGSIHHVLGVPLSKIVTNKNVFRMYLNSIIKMVENSDIDAVAHFDHLKRFINIPEVDIELVKEVLNALIANNVALEINSSGIRRVTELFPNEPVIELYKELGGRKVVLGSDMHKLKDLYRDIPYANEVATDYRLEKGIVLKRSFRKITK